MLSPKCQLITDWIGDGDWRSFLVLFTGFSGAVCHTQFDCFGKHDDKGAKLRKMISCLVFTLLVLRGCGDPSMLKLKKGIALKCLCD